MTTMNQTDAGEPGGSFARPEIFGNGLRTFAAVFVILACAVLRPGAAFGGDWPQWRHDAERSGATEENGPALGRTLWRLDLGRPDPAFDHQYRMCADTAYAPIAAEGLLFVPSNAADEVAAYDLRTGERAWRFVAEGPVRFAPVYRDGKVYFGSDDGRFYCLTAKRGELVWKTRGTPPETPDARMLINGRMCSRWPVRGGAVLHEGTVFFGAGIWPEEGVYVCAVDAETGKTLWRGDAMSYVENGMSDHGAAYDLSLPPHGYLAVVDGKLAVPSARSLAAWFDPATGAMEPYTSFYVKTNPPRGAWFVFGAGRYAVQAGNWFATRAEAKPPLPPELKGATSPLYWSKSMPENEKYVVEHRPFLRADTYNVAGENFYTEPVLTKSALFVSEFVSEGDYIIPRGHTHIKRHVYDRIVARDLTRPRWTTVMKKHFAYGKKNLPTPRLEFPVLWELKSPLKVLAKGGRFLYAGGENRVAAIAVPVGPGEKPSVAWEAKVEGYPVNALIADGVLAIVTDTGSIHCFGDKGEAQSSDGRSLRERRSPDRHTSPEPSREYALQLGWGDGKAARTLAEGNRYRVVVLEPDKAKATAARAVLSEEGLTGRQIQILAGNIHELPLTSYWASRVVFGSAEPLAANPRETLGAALDALRPYTGKLTPPPGEKYADLLAELAAAKKGYALSREDGRVAVLRKAPPEGAADWTHEMAGPGNRFSGSDKLVKWPLGVLWYSGDIDRFFTPATHFQHERNPHGLVSQGRMFLITGHFLHCVDIYTGNYLWKTELPLTPWIKTWYYDSRAAGRSTERSYVAAEDLIYIVTGKEIHSYETATGKAAKVIAIPEALRTRVQSGPLAPKTMPYKGKGAPLGWKSEEYQIQTAPEWTEVRLFGDLLLAMLGPNLAAVDRRSGELQWCRESSLEATVFAIGGDRLFGLDFRMPPNERRGPVDVDTSALLFALNPRSGDKIWEKEVDLSPQTSVLPRIPNPWNAPALPTLTVNVKHGLLLANVDMDKIHAVRMADGEPVWSREYDSGGYRGGHMVATDDRLMVSGYNNFAGYLLDIATGKESGVDTGIPQPRTCGLIIGNNNLLTYRDAATEFYDIQGNRTIGLNSVRAGCTASFFPAGGVMNAPMLGHGCVCNYPMFASLALYHLPWIEDFRPRRVKDSWVNEAAERAANRAGPPAANRKPNVPVVKIDTSGFRTINCAVEASRGGLRVATKEEGAGYAVKKMEKPSRKFVFRFTVQRAPAKTGTKRNGNAFFVFGRGGDLKDMMECRLYYGGRSSLTIGGSSVEEADEKMTFDRRKPMAVTVSVDLDAGTVSFETQGKKIVSKITGSLDAITHYGFGGSNSDSLIADFRVE